MCGRRRHSHIAPSRRGSPAAEHYCRRCRSCCATAAAMAATEVVRMIGGGRVGAESQRSSTVQHSETLDARHNTSEGLAGCQSRRRVKEDVLEVCRGPTAHLLPLSCWYRSLECKLSYLLIGSLAASIPLQALLAASECLSPPPREPAEPERADSSLYWVSRAQKAWEGVWESQVAVASLIGCSVCR